MRVGASTSWTLFSLGSPHLKLDTMLCARIFAVVIVSDVRGQHFIAFAQNSDGAEGDIMEKGRRLAASCEGSILSGSSDRSREMFPGAERPRAVQLMRAQHVAFMTHSDVSVKIHVAVVEASAVEEVAQKLAESSGDAILSVQQLQCLFRGM